MTTVIILISFLFFSNPAQPGGDTGDQITLKVLMQRGSLPRAAFPSGTHCSVAYITPMSLSSFVFFSIKVLIVLGHRVSGKVLLVYIRKCLALNSKHIKDLAISFYEYEKLWAVMGLPNLIRCWHQDSCGFGFGFIIRKLNINFLQGINQLSKVRIQLDVFTRPIAPQSNCSWLYTFLLLILIHLLYPSVECVTGNIICWRSWLFPTPLCIHAYIHMW